MNDNTEQPPNIQDKNPETDPVAEGVVSLQSWRKDKENAPAVTVKSDSPKARRYVIELKSGPIEIEGFVGLTGSFLAIGNEDGMIKFGAAQGEWLTVKDVTDNA